MLPPIFNIVNADSAVIAALGPAPVRVYPFGLAPQNVKLPYVTWQTISGAPENYLGDLPDADSYTLQVDVWAATSESVLQVARALRDAVEPVAYVAGWGNTARDNDTKYFRYTFTIDFIVQR